MATGKLSKAVMSMHNLSLL